MLPLTRHLRDTLEKASAERQAPMLPGKKKRLGGWTENATTVRYDHAERVEELRAAGETRKRLQGP